MGQSITIYLENGQLQGSFKIGSTISAVKLSKNNSNRN